MKRSTALCAALTAMMGSLSQAAELLPTPGLYRVEVRVSLPNVQDTARPATVTRCLTTPQIETGEAFFVLSDNPLKSCELRDYRVTGQTAAYRITCPGPNRGSAVGVFDLTSTGYRGSIQMNMGGKNMTMPETQAAKRIGDCD